MIKFFCGICNLFLMLCVITSCRPGVSLMVSSRATRALLVGDGITDDRAAFQDILNQGAGTVITIPPGQYLLGKGAGSWCVHVPDNTTVRGYAVTLHQAIVPGSVRLIDPGVGVTLLGLTLDGQRSIQVPDEHRSGVFAMNAVGLVMRDMVAHDFTGDGFTIHSGTNLIELDDLTAYGNGRSGLAFTGCSDTASVRNLVSYGNAVKALHTEPGAGCHVDNVTVVGGSLDSTASGDWGISIAGGGVAKSVGWNVAGVAIKGGVYVIGAHNVWIADNDISNVGNKPAVMIYRNADDITIDSNRRITATGAPSVIEITGTDINNIPSAVISNNPITSIATSTTMGVHAISARSVVVRGNTITGTGLIYQYAYGVYARSAIPGANLSIDVRDNTVADWGSTGIVVADTGGGLISVSATNNTCTSVTGAERYCLNLPGVAVASGNVAGVGVTQLLSP